MENNFNIPSAQDIASMEKESVLSYYEVLYHKYLEAIKTTSSLEEKLEALEGERGHLAQQAKSSQSKVEYEESELRKLLKIRADEVDEWRHKYSNLEREYLNFRKTNIQTIAKGKEHEKKEVIYDISAVGEELNQWRMKCFAIEETAFAKERTLEEEIFHLRDLLTRKNMEIEELRYQVPQSIKNISVQNAQNMRIEQEYVERIRVYEEEIYSLQSRNEELASLLEVSRRESQEKYNRFILEKEGEKKSRDSMIQSKESLHTFTQNQDYTLIINRKEELISQLNKQLNDNIRILDDKSREVLILQRDLENFRKTLIEKEKLISELLSKIGPSSKNKTSEKQTLIIEHQTKIEELKILKDELKIISEKLEKRKKKYSNIKKYLSEAKVRETELTLLLENQKRKLDLFDQVNLKATNDASLLISGIRADYEHKLRISEETIIQLNNRNHERELHLSTLTERLALFERKSPSTVKIVSDDSGKRISLLNIEVNRLNLQLRQKTQEIEVMKMKLRRLDGGNGSSITLEYENRIMLLLREIEEWKLKFAEKDLGMSNLRLGTSSHENVKFKQLSDEVLRLTEILGFKNAEIDDLRLRQDVITVEGRVELQRELERLQRILSENNKLLEKTRGSREEVKILRTQNEELHERLARLSNEKEVWIKQQTVIKKE